MPALTRPARRAAAVTVLTLVLAGCAVDDGIRVAAPLAADPADALAGLLGDDVDDALRQALREGDDDILALAERLPSDGAAALAVAIDRSDATASARTSARRQARAATRGSEVPGVHTPIVVLDEPLSSSGQLNGIDLEVAGRTTLEVADQTSSYRSTVSRAGRAGETEVLSDERTTRVDVPACIPDAATGWDGEVRHDRVVEAAEGDARVRLETTMRATAHRSADDGPLALRDLRVEVTRTVTRPDGSRTVEQGTLSGSVPAVTLDSDPGGETTAGVRVSEGSPWLAQSSGDVFLSAVVALVPEIGAALRAAVDAHEGTGLCVRVVADARGVTTLGGGESTPVDAKVVDTRTGATLDGVPITTSGNRGTANPAEFASAGTTSFTAAGSAPPSALELSASTPRGGDTTTVRFGDGWAFSGVVLTVAVEDVSASQTWSGFVCGDPLVEPWSFTQSAEGIGDVTFEQVPYPLGSRPEGWGQVPMIEPLEGTASDEPPFRLYIDDVEPPEVTPTSQRVEVAVYPAGEMYCG